MGYTRCVWICLLSFFLLFFTSTNSVAANLESPSLIGTATWNFNLASTHDRLINYGDDYYGKSYLIMTFFPAAFTPV